MLEAIKIEPDISQPMTWNQICERHPDQWVALVEIDWLDENHSYGFRTARVGGAGKTRRAPLEQARHLRHDYPSIGHYFTGPIEVPVPRILL